MSDLTEKILLLLSFIQANGAITGVVGFFGGWYMGNKIAVLADRRKEYNLIADKIRASLRSDIERIKHGVIPNFSISDDDFTALVDCYYTSVFETVFCGISKSRLMKAKAKYQEGKGIKYTDYDPIAGTYTLVIQPDFKTLSVVVTNIFKQVPHK